MINDLLKYLNEDLLLDGSDYTSLYLEIENEKYYIKAYGEGIAKLEISKETYLSIIKDYINSPSENTALRPIAFDQNFYSYDNGDNIDMQPSMVLKSYKCPVCNTHLDTFQKYCHTCGQKINWDKR